MQSRAVLAQLVLAPLLLASPVGCGGDDRPEPVSVRGTSGSIVDVGGFNLYFECAGAGEPTVILESGFGEPLYAWEEEYEPVSAFTRVCRYDRAGLGTSEPGPRPRSSATIAGELATLLRNARIEGPYILVGHSYGGMHLRVFAGEHRDDVAGVVFVDSSHPDQRAATLRALGPRTPGESAEQRAIRRELTTVGKPADNPEHLDMRRSEAEVRRSGSLEDIPVVVLTAGQSDFAQVLPQAIARRLDDAWLGLQARLRRLSSNSVHAIAPYSGHAIQSALGQPELVVRAVKTVVEVARRDAGLPSCRTVFRGLRVRCVAP